MGATRARRRRHGLGRADNGAAKAATAVVGARQGWLARIRGRIGGRSIPARVVQLIRFAIFVIELIIAVRILLTLAGANPQAGFTSFVNTLSSPFVGPFATVFTNPLLNGHPFELGSLLAMGIYAVLAYAAVRIVRGLFTAAHL